MNLKLSRYTLCIFLLLCGLAANAQYSAKRELRAAWIATVSNIDWPSRKGLTSHQQQAEFVTILDHLRSIGMNAVIVQVRPVADALYPSSFEPWSEYLSGTQGQHPEPYYNPLAFMIEQARLRGMEFHAWFNPYRASMKPDFVPSAGHPVMQHPEWFLKYGGKLYYDPGHPEAREFVLQSIMETVKHYDLDAVHFDDYFYPYRVANEEFPDSCSYGDYGKNRFAQKDDWRRDNVDFFVEALSERIRKEKPHVKFGISPFGVWRNIEKDSLGSNTKAGVTNYDDLYADVLKWLKEGWIDYVTPQLYWHIGFEKAEYKTLVDWWSRNAYGKHVYIGQGAYRVGEKGWEDPEEIGNQITYNRSVAGIQGSMYFSTKTFMQNKAGINEKVKRLYPHNALVPVMPWIKAQPVYAPQLDSISGTAGGGLKLEWSDVQNSASDYYIIYRYKSTSPGGLDDPSNIIAVIPRQPFTIQTWTDRTADKRSVYTYLVTASDRLHNESPPGNAYTVKTKGRKGKIKSTVHSRQTTANSQ
jgi:uncharacterized lipoprotein YddW (UPF0748 family)